MKRVFGVDASGTNGFCFRGGFVPGAVDGLAECADGFYIVCSVGCNCRFPQKFYAVYQVCDGVVEKLIDWVRGRDWALRIRDELSLLIAFRPFGDYPLLLHRNGGIIDKTKRTGMASSWYPAVLSRGCRVGPS